MAVFVQLSHDLLVFKQKNGIFVVHYFLKYKNVMFRRAFLGRENDVFYHVKSGFSGISCKIPQFITFYLENFFILHFSTKIAFENG